MKEAILSLRVGDIIWNIGGLDEIIQITATGISSVDNAAYCCYYTKFGKNGRMSGSIRENRAKYKDGYLIDDSIIPFIPNHKASDFI